ncbi:MAG TPA: ACT domain-containing protein [Candidatus Thermoplasmatota archaeon]|nr:ACT domain-containing protein [Candidatus Thermoplasmatota archaeon]
MTKEFVVSLQNRPGSLAEFCAGLARANVNITGMACVPGAEFGTFRFTVTPTSAPTAEAWLRTKNIPFVTRDVLTRSVPNTPGALATICRELFDSGVNIDSMYGFAGERPGEVELCIEPSPEHFATAKKVLGW